MAPKASLPRYSMQSRVVLPGSEKAGLPISAGEKPTAPATSITVSVLVRRKTPLSAANRHGTARLTRAQYAAEHAADPHAVDLVHGFAKEYRLSFEAGSPKPGRRIIKLTGTVANMQRAFGVTLVQKDIGGVAYRTREGSITLPHELSGAVEAVLGLDNRPQAKPHFRVLGEQHGAAYRAAGAEGFAKPHAAPSGSYTPVQVGALYNFPKASAAGQTIGIIELGGGFRKSDITAYFKSIGQKAPSVVAVSVDKGKNSPTNANSADGEVMLDIEVAAAVAPGASIVVYFAPNTDQGFIDAIAAAVHDQTHKPSVISISWGGPESSWTQQAMSALDAACQSAAALGITITVAAGDDGSTDGVPGKSNHVDFPASSPHVLACGGTKLVGTGSTISSEVVWNELANQEGATGGGVSAIFPLPSWQAGAGVPKPSGQTGGRGVPDVAGDADPTTGYIVRVDGSTSIIGGTSAVAPLMAGLIAVSNAVNKKSAGFINPVIYTSAFKSAFNDITKGNNGGFTAKTGWDACTGLGSPNGTKLVALLGSASGGSAGNKRTARKSSRKAG